MKKTRRDDKKKTKSKTVLFGDNKPVEDENPTLRRFWKDGVEYIDISKDEGEDGQIYNGSSSEEYNNK